MLGVLDGCELQQQMSEKRPADGFPAEGSASKKARKLAMLDAKLAPVDKAKKQEVVGVTRVTKLGEGVGSGMRRDAR